MASQHERKIGRTLFDLKGACCIAAFLARRTPIARLKSAGIVAIVRPPPSGSTTSTEARVDIRHVPEGGQILRSEMP
jgi:hypothetical protein